MLATDAPKRKPGLGPEDTWIQFDEADLWHARDDPEEPAQPSEKPAEVEPDPLEYLGTRPDKTNPPHARARRPTSRR